MKRVQRTVRGGIPSRTKYNELEDAINDHAALHGSDGIIVVDGNGVKINLDALLARLPNGVPVYEATTDAAAGEITVSPLNSDGTLVDTDIILTVLPD